METETANSLDGIRVVVTRARKQASKMSEELSSLGANVMEIPTIRIERSDDDDTREFAGMVAEAHTYEWLIFTSPNAVEFFFEAFYQIRSDAREIGGGKMAAVGPATKEKLAEYRMGTDLMPGKHVAEALGDAFLNDVGSIENMTMLWVRAKDASNVLSTKLIDAGVILDEAIAYQTIPETDDPSGMMKKFREEGADIITFTSGSTVDNFLDLGLDIPESTMIASIGPVTSAVIEENGYQVDCEAEAHDIPGLVAAVEVLAERLR